MLAAESSQRQCHHFTKLIDRGSKKNFVFIVCALSVSVYKIQQSRFRIQFVKAVLGNAVSGQMHSGCPVRMQKKGRFKTALY